VPVVVDIRDPWPDVIAELFPSPIDSLARIGLMPMERGLRRALRGASAITAVSPALLDWAIAHTGRARSAQDQMFPLGYMDRPAMDSEGAAKIASQMGIEKRAGQLFIVYFGMLGRQSELETVIDAAKILRADDRFRFVICGEGDKLEKYRRASADLTNITFTGFVKADRVAALSALADIGLAPYRSTPAYSMCMPNKIYEYMSGSLPIVSSLGGSVHELLERTQAGVSYVSGRPQELAQILIDLHANPEKRARMGEVGRQTYRAEFKSNRVYSAMAEYVERLAGYGRIIDPPAPAVKLH
jgi:glycosyltransferase involved in cell wall biosynthesis